VTSHHTALSLHGLSDVLPAHVHLTVPDAWRQRRLRVPAGIVIHQPRGSQAFPKMRRPMSAIRDLLDLPEEVTKSAFVVRLGEAVHRPDVLMDTYAVTKDIHHALVRGLGLIQAALTEKRNVAAFVHGSFGSGKSHYMAALSLLAGDHPRPWAEPALHDLYAKHEWVKGAKLLRLHLNLIDAASLGDKLWGALWGAYLDATRLAHPDAVLAPLFADEGLFANADEIRAQVGDETFFAELGKGAAVDARWGKKVGDAWSAARSDQSRVSMVSKERAALFSALVASYFPAFTQQASAYLPFDQALGAMTHHAKELGYDAVVFLDELVLWLAQKAANRLPTPRR